MTFTFKCYQNNFMINNLNILSFGDCFGSIIACMAFALLIELSRGIDLYLRHYSIATPRSNSRASDRSSERQIRTRRFLLHILRTLVHLVQTALSFILMLMVMNNFAGFLIAASIALGIGYYLLNGVHPYTRSVNSVHITSINSDFAENPTENDDQSDASAITYSSRRALTTDT